MDLNNVMQLKCKTIYQISINFERSMECIQYNKEKHVRCQLACHRLDLEALRYRLVVPKKSPGTLVEDAQVTRVVTNGGGM